MGCHADLISVFKQGASGMSDDCELRKKAREAMQAGKLPSHLPQRMWGGPGIGAGCTICGRPAGQDEVEFELEFGRDNDDRDLGIHHVHRQCFAAWELERTNFEAAGGSVSSSDGVVLETRAAFPDAEAEVSAVSGTLPAPRLHRMISFHEYDDGTDEGGSG